jgi:feruloyl esterase
MRGFISSFTLIQSVCFISYVLAAVVPDSIALVTRQNAKCSRDIFTLPSYASVASAHDETNDNYMKLTAIKSLCSVTVNIKPPGSTNNIQFEIWMPPKANWNLRFLTVGNSGFAGGIHRADMIPGAARGFATMSTDTGHANPDGTNMSFAANLNQRHDWAHRAMNYSVSVANDVIKTFYGVDKPAKSYYSGCSTGGRQGLKQIMIDPQSFDGLLIGAPAWDFENMMIRGAQVGQFIIDAKQKLNPGNITAFYRRLHDFVLDECDIRGSEVGGTDAVTDRIVSDPDTCNRTIDWDKSSIRCPNDVPGDTCITSEQAGIMRKLSGDGYHGNTFLYDGFGVSSAWMWGTYTLGTIPTKFDLDYVRYFLEHNDWTWDKNSAEIMEAAKKQKAATNAAADDFNLAGFKGKIIMYHGLNDGIIPSHASRRFWNRAKSSRSENIQDYFRYFEIPGMQHCVNTLDEMTKGTNAPWFLGGAGLYETYAITTAPVQYYNSKNDALLAMIDWVEKQTAPASLNVTSFKPYTTIREKSRLACPYPKVAKLKTTTSEPNDAASWDCVCPQGVGGCVP